MLVQSVAYGAYGIELQPPPPQPRPTRPAPLQKWRLKRVVEYVEVHLSDPIRLPDLAGAAGLTRMHFAAQFRIAVGMRPHHYVLRRRIDRACQLLRDPGLTLVEVALGVGFQTQAHFTTVFRRYVGETPHRWRRRASFPGPASAPGRYAANDAAAANPGVD